jgi:hypothetical protein
VPAASLGIEGPDIEDITVASGRPNWAQPPKPVRLCIATTPAPTTRTSSQRNGSARGIVTTLHISRATARQARPTTSRKVFVRRYPPSGRRYRASPASTTRRTEGRPATANARRPTSAA